MKMKNHKKKVKKNFQFPINEFQFFAFFSLMAFDSLLMAFRAAVLSWRLMNNVPQR